jgi:hypothetical protein
MSVMRIATWLALATVVAAGAARADTVTAAAPPLPFACKATFECPAPSICSASVCVPPRAVSPADEQASKEYADKGRALYDHGDYEHAVEEYQHAYDLAGTPIALKYIGLCEQALHHPGEARDALRRYLEESRTFPAGDPAQTQQLVADLSTQVGDLKLQITPDAAEVVVDGVKRGASPLGKSLPLTGGSHAVEVSATGYVTQKQDLMITAGAESSITIALAAIPKTGKVKITSPVTNAMLTVDGRLIGAVPTEVELDRGDHAVELSASKYQTYHGTVTVEAGQSKDVSLALSPATSKQPWYMNHVVWGFGGAAVLLFMIAVL